MKKNYSTRFLELISYGYENIHEDKTLLQEFTLSRLLGKHYKDGFIILSTCRGELTAEENNMGFEWLKERMTTSEFPYTNVFGGFIENKDTPEELQVMESAILIMNSKRGTGEPFQSSDAIKQFGFDLLGEISILGGKLIGTERVNAYAQDSFLYKPQGDTKEAMFLTANGTVDMVFNDVITNDITQEYFTAITKSRNPDKVDRRITFAVKKDNEES